MIVICRNCRFWQTHPTVMEEGFCLRNAPVPIMTFRDNWEDIEADDDWQIILPETDQYGGCGEGRLAWCRLISRILSRGKR